MKPVFQWIVASMLASLFAVIVLIVSWVLPAHVKLGIVIAIMVGPFAWALHRYMFGPRR